MSAVIIPGKNHRLDEITHKMNEEWLRARVVGWMVRESERTWFIAALLANGEFLWRSHDGEPLQDAERWDAVRRVLRGVNKNCHHGGAWLVGFLDGDFYMLWKDRHGDLAIDWKQSTTPWAEMKAWATEDFERHAEMCWMQWHEWHRTMDYAEGQDIRIVQGERPSWGHMVSPLSS